MSYSSSSSSWNLEVPQVEQVVDRGPAVDPRPVLAQLLDQRLLDVVLVLDLADDLLEEVLDRDQARRPAVLVEHDRDVDLAPLELVQQVVDRHRLRDEDRRPEQRAQVGPAAPTSDLRNGSRSFAYRIPMTSSIGVLVDGHPRVALVDHRVDGLVEGGRRRQGDDRDPRHHHLVQAPVAELDDRVDHLLLLGLEDPLLPAALHDQPQLLGRDLRLGRHLGAEQAGDASG